MERVSFTTMGFLLLGTWLLGACQSPKGFPEASLDARIGTPLAAEDSVASTEDALPFQLLDVRVEGDSLRVQVSYGGGCGEHVFELRSAGPTLRSMPPKQPLVVVHRSPGGDPCRALIQEWRSFDIQSFQASPRGLTVLLLDDHTVSYTYD